MNKIKLKIIGLILAFLFCFPLHFLYDKFPCFFTSIFAPVNESIWEHMKIIFGSIILSGIIQKIIVIVKKEKINNICFSTFISAILAIPIYLILFLPFYYLIGHNMIITLILLFITLMIAEYISYKITEKKECKLENGTIFFVIITYCIFAILTYYPLKNSLFIDPTTETYGITKDIKK